jgi:hypothetical protein
MTAKKEEKQKEKKELGKLNPDIREIEVGRKRLYNLTVYPLAFGQQFEISEVISKAITGFYQEGGGDQPDIAVVTFLVSIIQDNAGKVLEFVTDPDEVKEILKETGEKNLLNVISNKQVVTIAETIYEDNFETVSKKVVDLFRKMKIEHLSERSLPDSLDDSLSTDSPTSSEEDTETEVLQ